MEDCFNGRRNEIVEVLAGLYRRLHAKNLPIYSLPLMKLDKFSESDSTKKIHKYTIPEECYRLKSLAGFKTMKEETFEEGKQKSKTLYQRVNEDKNVTLSDFKIIMEIGKGGFGVVYLLWI